MEEGDRPTHPLKSGISYTSGWFQSFCSARCNIRVWLNSCW